MRDRLNALVMAGKKVATAGLWRVEYESGSEALDTVGERQVMLDPPVRRGALGVRRQRGRRVHLDRGLA
jgi:uncharacterized protein YhfF